MADDEAACTICLDGSGTLLRKGCACRGSSSWAHAECMARAVAVQLPRRGESETLWRAVHACRVRTLGAEDPLTLASQASLALALSHGQLAEAERLFEATIDAQTRVLGPEHAHTLVAKSRARKIFVWGA
jgi:hypothetical protein